MSTELTLLTCTSLQDLDQQMLAGFINLKGITAYWDHFIPSESQIMQRFLETQSLGIEVSNLMDEQFLNVLP